MTVFIQTFSNRWTNLIVNVATSNALVLSLLLVVMTDSNNELFKKQLKDCKHLFASSVVLGNIIYGVRAFKSLPPLPAKPTQIDRRERIITVAQRSFFGGLRFGGLVGTFLACDYGLQQLRNVDQDDKLNKVLAGTVTGGILSLVLGGGPAVAVSGSLSLGALGFLYQMTVDTFKYVDEQVARKKVEPAAIEKEDE